MNYNFEWDINKARNNLSKHKISFERAASIFNDPMALSIFEEEHSSLEKRWITIGVDSNGIIIVVCHTYSDKEKNDIFIRIFSARKATRKEKKQYEGK